MRELGELGMSFGTSQAFESQEGKFALSNTDSLLINLRTLIRNAQSAFQDEASAKTNPGAIKDAVMDDIKLITKALIEIAPRKPINLKVYYPSYKGLKSIFPKADLWEPTTEKQKAMVKLFDDTAKLLIKEYPSLFTLTDSRLEAFTGKGVVITHHPVDLVLTDSWNRLSLLETHSGTVKPHIMWYTKLTGKDLENMPLNKLTIQVFGDQSTNFKSSSNAIKKLVRDLAVKARWTSATTPERVKTSIDVFTTGVDKVGLQLLI